MFLKFWLEDACRNTLLSYLEPSDLASLRLTCHDFSVRAAPALFSHLTIRFRTNTFSKPSRLAALERCGFYVKTLKFVLPHSNETFLPPLVDPESGAGLNFTYTPAVQETRGKPKFGDEGTTEILTRQWPPLFHAATNVPAFVRAFGALVNLEGLEVSCPSSPSPGMKDGRQRGRKGIVDFALISLRIAVERNCLNSLEKLVISPIHAQGVMFLSPVLGIGAGPSAMRRWGRIKKLEMEVECTGDEAEVKLVKAYLRSFQRNLQELRFSWIGEKGPLPVATPMSATQTQQMPATATRPLFGEQRPHPAHARHPPPNQHSHQQQQQKDLHFPSLKHLELSNITCPSTDLSTFISSHRHTLEELDFQNFELTAGTWEEALQPLTSRSKQHQRSTQQQRGEIPIMLYPAPMKRIAVPERKGVRVSSSSATTATTVARRVREGLLGCEMQLKRVLRGSAFPWR